MVDLIPYFQEADFRLKTQQQLAKDFAQHGLFFRELFSTESLNPDEIIAEIQTKLTEFIATKKALLPLLYTIDIPEKKYQTWLLNESNNLENLTWMLVEREAQKVYLREKFRNS